MKYLGWTGLFAGPMYGIGMLAAGTVMAIMIIPNHFVHHARGFSGRPPASAGGGARHWVRRDGR